MMAIDVKVLNGRERVWVNGDTGEVINVDRAWKASDCVIAERRLDAELLAAASLSVEGKRQWFALRVGKRSEIELCKVLTDSRVDAVVPVKQVPLRRRLNAQSRKLIHKPVLGGLVFVNIVPSREAFAGLMRVKEVAAIVGEGESPYPIGDREMNGFMDLAQKGAFDERNTPTGLKVGSRVRMSVGTYADMEGVLAGYVGTRTARVRTWLFGGEMTIDVTLAHIEKLE